MQRRRHRDGFTLLEVVVSCVILAMLMAILTSAVQDVREATRATECRSHFQQIGRAVGGYEARTGYLLPLSSYLSDIDGHPSPHFFLLPDIEQSAIYGKTPWISEVVGDPRLISGGAHGHVIPLYLCPTDGSETGTNIRFNLGADVRGFRGKDYHRGWGPIWLYPGLSSASVTDGLSNTAMASESLISRPDLAGFDNQRDTWVAGFEALDHSVITNELVLSLTAAAGTNPVPTYRYCGLIWATHSLSDTFYNHVVAPNADVANSNEKSWFADEKKFNLTQSAMGIHKASSQHPGGVNLLLADGAVRFNSEAIDLQVWRALGSAAGGETR